MGQDEIVVTLPTGIPSLDLLLNGGIHFHRKAGLFGIIVGATATGKSVLGMQLCCRFIIEGIVNDKHRSAVYISQEPPELVAARIAQSFQHFRCGIEQWTANNPPFEIVCHDGTSGFADRGGQFHLCHLKFNPRLQQAFLEEIFTLGGRLSGEGWERLLVCLDNIDAIHDAALSGQDLGDYEAPEGPSGGNDRENPFGFGYRKFYEQRTGDLNFFRRLRERCAQQGINAILIFEEKPAQGYNPELFDISTTPEAYAADVVIRLGLTTHQIGFRERFIEIVKAKNQFYYRGKHPCSVVSLLGGDRPGPEALGLVVYPSVTAQLSWLKRIRDHREQGKNDRATGSTLASNGGKYVLGIDSLDDRIQRYVRATGAQNAAESATGTAGYIIDGSCSVLVSDLDAKATEIALHFALSSSPAVFISTLHEVKDLERIAGRFDKLRAALGNGKRVFRFFPTEHISGAKLLRDIDHLIFEARLRKEDSQEPVTVVLDNVFELRSKFPLVVSGESFLMALFELFRVRRVTCLVVDTVRAGEARNPIEVSVAAGLADNVFLLRHVEFQSRPHHVFSVLKLLGARTPELLWDLDERTEDGKVSLEAADTFALYTNVLSGRPEPIPITLTLYMDQKDSPFHNYLLGQVQALQESFGPNIKARLYGPDEYAKVQATLTSADTHQRAECHVVALDEFWLEKLIRDDALEDVAELMGMIDKTGEYVRTQYVSAAHDMVLYNRAFHPRPGKQQKPFDSNVWYAVPARNNCGVLCCNPLLVKEVSQAVGGELHQKTSAWLDRNEQHGFAWTDLMALREKHEDKRRQHPERYPPAFFSFCMDQAESCVSFVLELALSFGLRKELITHDGVFHFDRFPSKAIQTLFSLLSYPDIATIAAGLFRLPQDEPAALFTRQWVSTLGCLRTRREEGSTGDRFLGLEAFELPWGPDRDHPTPVSGTWYAGILKGSVAVEAGARVINQFTSVADELYKLSNCIGLPVRRLFYDPGGDRKASPFALPYQRVYSRLAEVQHKVLEHPEKQNEEYEREILQGDCPFYRMVIADYSCVAPILWRMIVRVARGIAQSSIEAGAAKEQLDRAIEAAVDEFNRVRPAH